MTDPRSVARPAEIPPAAQASSPGRRTRRATPEALGKYAQSTTVPVDQSQVEIKRVLRRYGCSESGIYEREQSAAVNFRVKGRELQWTIPLPSKTDKAFTHQEYRRRTDAERDRLIEQETRRRWRVMLITLKALLEAVESKIMTFDAAFLPHIVIPGSAETFGQFITTPKLDALYGGQGLKALLAENPVDGRPAREP